MVHASGQGTSPPAIEPPRGEYTGEDAMGLLRSLLHEVRGLRADLAGRAEKATLVVIANEPVEGTWLGNGL